MNRYGVYPSQRAAGGILDDCACDVRGSIVELKQPGRVRGRGEMVIRFEEIVLPNGITRPLNGATTGLDGRSTQRLEEGGGRITGEGSAGRDAATVARSAGTGAIIGAVVGRSGADAGIGAGAGAGAAAALLAVLLTHGSGIYLPRGATMEIRIPVPRDGRYTDRGRQVRTKAARGGSQTLKPLPACRHLLSATSMEFPPKERWVP